ncbi:hypothetical protein GCM10022222_22890 [Amycolatopsis ultiminotia]|uniref:Excreted virulence factor EspC, type VII ESX diderm n=1 Tax=Amycolatopsis ultiminotia TaxID=543629 RepID=A0ABP6VNA9_9PSEU
MTGIEWDSPNSVPHDSAADAGNDLLAGLTEGPGSHEAAEKMRNAGNTLKNLAQNGAFAINDEGFQAYTKACDFFIDGYREMSSDLQLLTQKANMGSSEYARAVAEFNTTVADTNPEAMLPNLKLMLDAVQAAREAMVIARKNYRESESENTVSFTELNKKLDSQ